MWSSRAARALVTHVAPTSGTQLVRIAHPRHLGGTSNSGIHVHYIAPETQSILVRFMASVVTSQVSGPFTHIRLEPTTSALYAFWLSLCRVYMQSTTANRSPGQDGFLRCCQDQNHIHRAWKGNTICCLRQRRREPHGACACQQRRTRGCQLLTYAQ